MLHFITFHNVSIYLKWPWKLVMRLVQCNFSLSFQTPHGANTSLENKEGFTWQCVWIRVSRSRISLKHRVDSNSYMMTRCKDCWSFHATFHYIIFTWQLCKTIITARNEVHVHRVGLSASVHAGLHPPPGAVHAGRYGQQAGGTHPTGMHTCLDFIYCCRIQYQNPF